MVGGAPQPRPPAGPSAPAPSAPKRIVADHSSSVIGTNGQTLGNAPGLPGPWYQGQAPAPVPAWFTAQNNTRQGLNALESLQAANNYQYDARRGLDVANYNAQVGFLGQGRTNDLAGIALRDNDNLSNWNALKAHYGIDSNLNRQNMGFARTGLNLSNRDVSLRMGRDRRALLSDATGRGATMTQGFRQGNADINQQGANDRSKNQLQYDSTTARLTADQKNRDVDLSRNQDIFTNIGARNNLDRQNAQLAYDKGMQSLGYDLATSQAIINAAQNSENASIRAQATAMVNQSIQMGSLMGSLG